MIKVSQVSTPSVIIILSRESEGFQELLPLNGGDFIRYG